MYSRVVVGIDISMPVQSPITIGRVFSGRGRLIAVSIIKDASARYVIPEDIRSTMAIIQMSQTGTLSVLGLVDFELTGVRVIKLCLFEYVKGYSSKVVALSQQSIGDIFLWLNVIENGHPPSVGVPPVDIAF
jgi:hypothetical protein